MVNRLTIWISLCVLICNSITVVETADQCKVQNDCTFTLSCCLTTSGEKRCEFGNCDFCITDNDCGDSNQCCRSNECVQSGCSGCKKKTDCSLLKFCCKKTFPLNQTFCASSCVDESCNSNDDCGGLLECCRSGKCTRTGCFDQCSTNSECDASEYCCKKKKTFSPVTNPGCCKSCVGERCSSNDDCGGPNECCISNKCVTAGCSGCDTNSNCSTGHYCCKKTFPVDQRFCASSCINETCNSDADCGEQDECCIANKCVKSGCSECTTNSDCSSGLYCCSKKTFSLTRRFCSSNCINESCSVDDDCREKNECCRSGNCVKIGCDDKCKLNSECDFGKYCCGRKTTENGCRSGGCVGETCNSDNDCGGPNECCISKICVKYGCSGCITSSDCSTTFGHYCCKNRKMKKLGECSSNCIGKLCSSDNDCGSENEVCDSENICGPTSSPVSSSPPWRVPVIVVVIVVFFIAVVVFWYFKRKRQPANATQVNRGAAVLQNTQNQGRAIWNPIQLQETILENPPPYTYNNACQNLHHQRNQAPISPIPNQYEAEGYAIPSKMQNPAFHDVQSQTDDQKRGNPPPYYP